MSVTLDSINESQKSSRKRSGEQQTEVFDTSITLQPDQPKKGEREFVIFKLVKKGRGKTTVDGICYNIENPKTGKRETARLFSGANSIWSSELNEQLKDKDWVNRSRRSLEFYDGICRLSIHDETGIEYARICTKNVGKMRSGSGKWDYYEYDPLEEAMAKSKREDKEFDMMVIVKDMLLDKMKKMAAYFGVRFTDDYGIPVPDEAIRLELRRKAKQDPYHFEKYIGSDEIEISWLVRRAITEAKIDLTGQTGNAIWAGGSGFICKIPADRKPHEYLTELAMTNSEEGKIFKQQLQTLIT